MEMKTWEVSLKIYKLSSHNLVPRESQKLLLFRAEEKVPKKA